MFVQLPVDNDEFQDLDNDQMIDVQQLNNEINFEQQKKDQYNQDPDLIKQDLNDVLAEIPNRKSLKLLDFIINYFGQQYDQTLVRFEETCQFNSLFVLNFKGEDICEIFKEIFSYYQDQFKKDYKLFKYQNTKFNPSRIFDYNLSIQLKEIITLLESIPFFENFSKHYQKFKARIERFLEKWIYYTKDCAQKNKQIQKRQKLKNKQKQVNELVNAQYKSMIEVDILSDEELEENVFFKDTNKI